MDTQTAFCEDRGPSARLAGSMASMSKVTMGHDRLQLVSNTDRAGDLLGTFPMLRIDAQAARSIAHLLARSRRQNRRARKD
jgi:hypothetical protein